MALTDNKILPADELGKLHEGMPKNLADIFNTYQEVQTFIDSHGQLVKEKHNGLIDDVIEEFATVNANMEQKADKATAIITDANLAIKNGKYAVVTGGGLNIPLANHTFIIDVSQRSDIYLVQRAKCYSLSPYDSFERCCLNGTWTEWVKIATTNKIDISSTLVNGWVIADNTPLTLTVSGKIANVTGRIKDGSRVKGTTIFTLPAGIRPSQYMLKKIYSHVASPVITGLFRLDTNVSDIRIDNNYDLAVAATHIVDITFPII